MFLNTVVYKIMCKLTEQKLLNLFFNKHYFIVNDKLYGIYRSRYLLEVFIALEQ